MKHPLACLALAAGAAIGCAFFVNPQVLLVVMAICAVSFLGVFWPTIALRGVTATVSFEKWRGREGEPVRVVVRIRNRAPWPVWGLSLERGFGGDVAGLALAKVSGWATSQFEWEFTPPCRGQYPLETPVLETSFPFGIWRGRRPTEVEGKLIVWPLCISLDAIPEAADLRPSSDVLSPHRVGDAGDLMGTRLFREGDSLRRVHWAQTARHNQLITCERQSAAQSSIEVVLDVDERSHSGHGADCSLEWAIRLTASICESLQAFDAQVQCLIGRERILAGRGLVGMRRLLDRLACIPQSGLSAQPLDCHCPCGRSHSGALQFFITTELGMRHLDPENSYRSERRYIVLNTSGFGDNGSQLQTMPVHFANAIAVETAADARLQFAKKWRKSCHAS